METSVSLNPKVLLEIYPSNKDRRETRTVNNVHRLDKCQPKRLTFNTNDDIVRPLRKLKDEVSYNLTI